MADDKRLERIETKIDHITDKIVSLDITSAKQQTSLDEHIRRTNLLEEEIRPIKKHVDRVNGALSVIGFIAVLVEVYKAFK